MKYHEAAQHLADLAKAEAEGKDIQYYFQGVWSSSSGTQLNAGHILDKPERYRIAPTPTFRPWTVEEVPVGAVVKAKQCTITSMIVQSNNDSRVHLGDGGIMTTRQLLDCWTLADGTPCGTEVTA